MNNYDIAAKAEKGRKKAAAVPDWDKLQQLLSVKYFSVNCLQ